MVHKRWSKKALQSSEVGRSRLPIMPGRVPGHIRCPRMGRDQALESKRSGRRMRSPPGAGPGVSCLRFRYDSGSTDETWAPTSIVPPSTHRQATTAGVVVDKAGAVPSPSAAHNSPGHSPLGLVSSVKGRPSFAEHSLNALRKMAACQALFRHVALLFPPYCLKNGTNREGFVPSRPSNSTLRGGYGRYGRGYVLTKG